MYTSPDERVNATYKVFLVVTERFEASNPSSKIQGAALSLPVNIMHVVGYVSPFEYDQFTQGENRLTFASFQTSFQTRSFFNKDSISLSATPRITPLFRPSE